MQSDGALLRFSQDKRALFSTVLSATGDRDFPKANYISHGIPVRELKSKSDRKVLFVGDSLIEQYYPKVNELHKKGLGHIWFITEPSCLPIKGMFKAGKVCDKIDKTAEYLEGKLFDIIVVTGYWFPYINEISPYYIKENGKDYSFNSKKGSQIVDARIKDIFSVFKQHSKKIYFLMPTPTGYMFSPKEISRKIFVEEDIFSPVQKSFFSEKYQKFYDYIGQLSTEFDFELIDPMDDLCKNDYCFVVDKDGNPFYKDRIHLRPKYVLENAHYLDILLKTN